MRRTYLITYSQADLQIFPTRRDFGQAVSEAFNSGSGKVGVHYWACSQENHNVNNGVHYHMSVKLTGPKRWSGVKRLMTDRYGVVLHFSESHDNYYSAYRYITKSDGDVFHSEKHPNLKEIGSPQTKKCVAAYREKCRQKNTNAVTNDNNAQSTTPQNTNNTTKEPKPRRLTNFDVSEFLVAHNIRTDTELHAIAEEQRKAGKKDLAVFVLNRNSKALCDLIENTWKMQAAPAKLRRMNVPRMDTIREYRREDCVRDCEGQWFEMAMQVLRQNRVHPHVFAEALRNLLEKGRGKYRNLMIVGPGNCAKTFLLKPLQDMFETFSNPSVDKFAWLGAESAEIIFLNDIRWKSEMIAWKELLLLLEGQIVHLPAPKNHYSKDICITADTPIFATGKERIVFEGPNNSTDEIENDMMASRWKVFEFHHRIPQAEQITVTPCPKCFSDLVCYEEGEF